ncbi:ABC transporter ATP-binding protein [Leifsonia sp. P73]|uniref:ABC transporter ATP-binding protein n=1 Tax=Leifsonia sp. P73 TaxID=3423959 RepID=UPI003DA3CFFF
MPTLDVQDVTRTFNGANRQTVLRGVSMSIDQGEFVAIEGPSGGGKSTLLNIIGSLDTPTTGTYLIGRTDVQKLSDRAISKLRSDTFAFVFQSFHLLDRRAAIHSVELGLTYRGVKPKERRQRALEAMDALGIRHLADTRSSKLSGGERQRVALARALACEAPVIVADEPTGSLDSVNAAAVVDALERLNSRGTTVVLVTHSAEVAAAARKRIRMSDGRTTEIATSDLPDNAVQNVADMPGTASTLRLHDVLADATANIAARLGKTSGLVAAVALAVALTVGSLGISGSASAQVSERFDSHSNRDVTVEWKPGLLDDQPADMQVSASRRLGELRGVTSAAIVSSHGQTDVQAGPGRPSYQVNAFTGTSEGWQPPACRPAGPAVCNTL